jgi:hypothetical protein
MVDINYTTCMVQCMVLNTVVSKTLILVMYKYISEYRSPLGSLDSEVPHPKNKETTEILSANVNRNIRLTILATLQTYT